MFFDGFYVLFMLYFRGFQVSFDGLACLDGGF